MDAREAIDVDIAHDVREVETSWRHLETVTRASVYQRFDWVAAWVRHVAPSLEVEPRIAIVRDGNRTVGILPLGRHKLGPIGVLTNLSDSHTNFVGGLFDAHFARNASEEDMQRVKDRLFAANGDVEGLSLCCLPEEWNGLPNPLRHWCSNASAHDAWACDLSDGFDAMLSRGNGKRKRKKHRAAARKFEAVGGWRIIDATTREDAWTMFGEAREHMHARFQDAGIRDPFEPSDVTAFMEEALHVGLTQERPVMRITALEVGGERIAWQAGGRSGDTLSLMFTVFRPSAFDAHGPGDFLLYEQLERAAREGVKQFDLGRGAEPYKLSWCDKRIQLLDIREGRTTRANILLAAHRQATALKRRVREDERLWRIAKAMRKLKAA